MCRQRAAQKRAAEAGWKRVSRMSQQAKWLAESILTCQQLERLAGLFTEPPEGDGKRAYF